MSKQMNKIIFSVIGLLIFLSLAWADDDRHITVDREIGGMEQGSRIGAPGSTPIPITDAHKTISSSQGTKKAETGPVTTGENHGNIYTNPSESSAEPISNPADNGAGAGGTGETSTENEGTDPGAGPAEGSSNPIVDADINVNPDSGILDADATVDTTGELEDKQILDTDLEAEGVTSVDADVGSVSEITNPPTTDSTQSSEPASNPIVGADVSISPESGTVETGATIDTSGELEEKQILDADLTAGETTSTETEVGSATDVTQLETVESTDITTEPISTVTSTATLTAEVDTTGATTGGETDVGVEADVSGVSEGEDVICDPADGLTSAACWSS